MCYTPPLIPSSFITITMALCLLSFGTVKARDLENIPDSVWKCSDKCQRQYKEELFTSWELLKCFEVWLEGEQWVLPVCVIKCLGISQLNSTKSCCPQGKHNICKANKMRTRTNIFEVQKSRNDHAWMRRLRIGQGRVKRNAETSDDELAAYFENFKKPTPPPTPAPSTPPPPPPPSTTVPPTTTLPPPSSTIKPPPPPSPPPLPPLPKNKKEEMNLTTSKPVVADFKKKPDRKIEDTVKKSESNTNTRPSETGKTNHEQAALPNTNEVIMTNNGPQQTATASKISTQGHGLQHVGNGGVQYNHNSVPATTQSYAETDRKTANIESTTKPSNLKSKGAGISKVQDGLKLTKTKSLG